MVNTTARLSVALAARKDYIAELSRHPDKHELDPIYGGTDKGNIDKYTERFRVYDRDSRDITEAISIQPPSHTRYDRNPLVASMFGLKVWVPSTDETSSGRKIHLPLYDVKWFDKPCHIEGEGEKQMCHSKGLPAWFFV